MCITYIHIPSTKTGLNLTGHSLSYLFFLMRKKNVDQYWSSRAHHSGAIYLLIKSVVKCLSVQK